MLFRETLAPGVNFDGTAGAGLIDFPTIAPVSGDDNDRIAVLAFSLAIGVAAGNSRLRDVYVVFAQNLTDAQSDGAAYEFAANMDVHQFVSEPGILYLPSNWQGFVFGAEVSGSFVKSFTLDYVRVDLMASVRGGRPPGVGC